MAAPRWIIFDAVGTLIYPEPSPGRAYWEIGRKFGSTLTEEEITRRFRSAFRISEREDIDGAGSHLRTSEEIERQRWRRIVAEVLDDVTDAEGAFEDLFAHFARPTAWRCFSDTAPTLHDLQQAGFRLGIASNFDGRLNAVCDALPGLSLLERRIVSAEIGHRKPSIDFFREVERITDSRPDELLMVGDDFENDVAGAQAAGWQAVYLCRRGEVPAGGVADLRQLTEFLLTPASESVTALPAI